MLKQFLKFVLPSMLAFVFSSLYAIVDGFFIGRSVGDVGLAAVSIAYPLTALIQAIGTGIGMGGAVPIAMSRGKGDRKQEESYLGNTLTLLGIASAAVTLLLLLSYRPILMLFGAEGAVLEAACDYTIVIIWGTAFQLLATGFTPLLRNYDAALRAMCAMIAGFLTNIVLDALFVPVLGYGLAGAAWATIIGQAVTLVPCATFLWKKTRGLQRGVYRLKGGVVRQVVKIGVSPFGLAMCPNFVTMLMNKSAMLYGGEIAVAAYAVVGYVNSVICLLLQGVGDGSQPLISFHLGTGNLRKAKQVRDLAYGFAALVSVLNLGAIFVLRFQIPAMFGASHAAADVATRILPLFALGAVFVAFCRVTTAYFYSVRENAAAYGLVYGEPILLFALLAFVFPQLFGLGGVWISVPAAQAGLVVVGLLLLQKKKPSSI